MPAQPTGTLTFLFTAIEGGATHWEHDLPAEESILDRHNTLLRQAIERHGGHVFKLVDGVCHAAFVAAPAAVSAAISVQRALHAESWPPAGSAVRVRMALHTGLAEARDGAYAGPLLNHLARLLAAGSGGQVLLSAATAELVRDHLPSGVDLRDLGQHRLQDLIRPSHIFQLCVPDLPAQFPPLKSLECWANNLPAQATPLVGRGAELADLASLLARPDVRLLTLIGPGGTGKTRLALQLAANLLDRYADGAFFVDLAPLDDHALVLSTIAAVLGVRESGSQSLADAVTASLQDKDLLLVLDNFEQVIEAAPLVTRLLAAGPRLNVVVTSRIVLRVYGEHTYPVPPLAVPPRASTLPPAQLTQYAAVALFIQRAQAVQPSFAVTNATAPAVAEICARLDGLPLAIELAAARIRLLPPPALLARLHNRLGILTGGARDLPARQQTLRGLIDWSYQLLSPQEQVLFARLAVFAGGRTLAAIEVVCLVSDAPEDALAGYDVLEGVASLVEKSLLRQDDGNTAESEPRFVLLETLHEYAHEALAARGETETLRARHAAYFLALVEQAAPHLTDAGQAAWLVRLDTEHDNLRAALSWAQEHNAGLGLRLATALWRFWYVRGYLREGRRWLEGLLSLTEAQGDQPVSLRALALQRAGALAESLGDLQQAATLAAQSLDLWRQLGDKCGMAAALNTLGNVATGQGDNDNAAAHYQASLSLWRDLGDKVGAASALNNLGTVARKQGNFAHAVALSEESLALRRELGDKGGIAIALHNLANVAREQGALGRAQVLSEESLALWRALGDTWGIASALQHLGALARLQGNGARATNLLEESLILSRELGNIQLLASCLVGFGHIAAERDRAPLASRRAATLLGAAHALCAAGGASLPSDADYAHMVAALHARLDADLYAAAWAEGQVLSLEEAISLAQTQDTQPELRIEIDQAKVQLEAEGITESDFFRDLMEKKRRLRPR